ncbi:MAG: LptF/LptG family permease [Candidatus Eisenbacteria bacterium]
MRLLDRYLLGQFLAWLFASLLSLVMLFIVIDLIERLDTFVDYKTPFPVIARYYGYGLTTILTQILPLSMLLGAILSLGQLKKTNELTAMQSAGQSPWRLARPLLLAGLLLSAAQYVLNERYAPYHYVENKRILMEEIKKISTADRESQANVRLIGGAGRFWVAQFYDARTAGLRSVTLQALAAPTIRWRIDADRASYQEDGVWRFERGYLRVFQDSTEYTMPFKEYVTTVLSEEPADFARRNLDPFHAGMAELLRFANRVKESGGETQKHMTNFHLRASYPLSGVIMVLLGAGLGMRVIRGGNLALGIGVSLAIGFGFFGLIRVGQALGSNGTLPPAAAAWLGNAVFLLLAIFLFRRVAH